MATITELKQAVAAAQAAYKADCAGLAKAKQYDSVVNEGGEGYNTAEAMAEAAYNKHMPLILAAENALFAAEWTKETLAARGAAWNAGMAKCKSYAQEAALGKKLGYNLADLKKAKALLAAK